MSNVVDYMRWRGDLTFTQDPPNNVDSLIFSALAYICWEGSPTEEPYTPIPLRQAAEEFFGLPDHKTRCRSQNDLELLRAAADCTRFGEAKLVRYRDQFVPEEDTQFAAMTWLLDDGSIYISFRGTDNTLVGWKEDFNMCYRQTVPAQRLAVNYVRELYAEYMAPMRICGHSKGGNLAVFSAARSSPMIQESILAVYNNDGPGFTDYMIGDPGYLAMVPRIHTFVPQSSVIGLLMEHEEPYTIVRSSQIAILQHDTFTWEVMGKELIPVEELTLDSRFIHETIKNWLREMDMEERNEMVEALFTLLTYGNVEKAVDIFHPKNLRNYLKLFGSDENIRNVLTSEFENLLEAAKKSRKDTSDQHEALEAGKGE